MAAYPTENATKLSSLTQWSQEHVRAIFESSSNEEFIQAIEGTFSSDLKATVNGKPVSWQEIKQSVLSMRAESSLAGGLRVEWKQTVEVPQDTYNRNGSFGGFYVIHNIQRRLAGEDHENDNRVKIERHKAVTVIIESQSPDTMIDSRKIVNLVFVASDRPVVNPFKL